MSQVKIGVLISGGGTNLQSVIDNIEAGKINGSIEVVISNKKDAYGLERAKKHNIDGVFVDRKKYDTDEQFNAAIMEELKKRNVELVVLAGYLKILTPSFISEYRNRIINIHPALIPSFCGKGYYGLHVHEAAIEYGVKLSGATVHFVNENADNGPIILQEAVAVEYDDTAETLQKKVLSIEHKILPEAVRLYCERKIEIVERKTKIIK